MKPLFGLLAILILQLALCSPARAALTQGKYTWWSLTAGAEFNQALDNDPYSFQGAESRTGSLYLSAGRGERWGVLAFNDLRLRQDWWTFRGLRGLLRLREESAEGMARGLWAFHTQGSLDWEGRGLGLELETPPLGPFRTGFELSWTEHAWLNDAGTRPAQQDREWRRLGLHLDWRSRGSFLSLGAFRQTRAGSEEEALLLRARHTFGHNELALSALHGRQSLWFDAESLVLHDGGSPLRGMLSASWKRPLWDKVFLRLGAGWTKSTDHENRWLFLGLGWSRGYWSL